MAENRQNTAAPAGGPGARGGYQKPKNAKRTMLRLLGYISGKKWLLVLVFLCVALSSVASLAGTYLIKPVLNDLVGDGSLSEKLMYLGKMLAVMAAVFLVGAACTYARSRPSWPSSRTAAPTACAASSSTRCRAPPLILRQKLPRRAHEPLLKRRRLCPADAGAEHCLHLLIQPDVHRHRNHTHRHLPAALSHNAARAGRQLPRHPHDRRAQPQALPGAAARPWAR